MAKEFSKKYMHPTRRKLVDMVHTGEYEKELSVGYREKKEHIIRKVGDKWEDERFVYEQKDGYVTKSGKNSFTKYDHCARNGRESNRCV